MIKSIIGDLTIRKVEEEDKSTVIHIKQEAARWLENKGIHQWAGILRIWFINGFTKEKST